MKWQKLEPPGMKWWLFELFYAFAFAMNVYVTIAHHNVSNAFCAVGMVATRVWVHRYLSRQRDE